MGFSGLDFNWQALIINPNTKIIQFGVIIFIEHCAVQIKDQSFQVQAGSSDTNYLEPGLENRFPILP
jgi:hypothetical protein